MLARAPQFDEHLLTVDLDLPPEATHADPPVVDGVRHVVISPDPVPRYSPDPALQAPETIADPRDGEAEVYRALVVGLRDYVRKNGFRSVVLGLSVRQVKRLCKRLREQGAAGLMSRRRGRPSNRRVPEAQRLALRGAGARALR